MHHDIAAGERVGRGFEIAQIDELEFRGVRPDVQQPQRSEVSELWPQIAADRTCRAGQRDGSVTHVQPPGSTPPGTSAPGSYGVRVSTNDARSRSTTRPAASRRTRKVSPA